MVLKIDCNIIPLDGILKGLKNLKLLEVSRCSPFLTHECLLPLVSRPNFTMKNHDPTGVNISHDGFQQIVQVGYKFIALRVHSCMTRTPKLITCLWPYSLPFSRFPSLKKFLQEYFLLALFVQKYVLAYYFCLKNF